MTMREKIILILFLSYILGSQCYIEGGLSVDYLSDDILIEIAWPGKLKDARTTETVSLIIDNSYYISFIVWSNWL